MELTLLSPEHRPALRAAEPAVWRLQGQGRHLRGEARSLLRALLAGYLGMAPAQVPLHFQPDQAPCVAARWQGLRLSISMSYSQDVALIALCPGACIGVDVTAIAALPDWAQVARLYLGPASAARLAACEGGGARHDVRAGLGGIGSPRQMPGPGLAGMVAGLA